MPLYQRTESYSLASKRESHSVVSSSLQAHGLYSPWNSPGQKSGVGSLSLLQWILPTRGSYPGLPHCRQTLYQLSHKESSEKLEWVAYPFSSGSSWPRNWTRVFLYYRGILYQLNSPWNLSYRQFGSGGIIVKCLSFNQSKWSTVIVKSSCTIYHTVIS